jgi:plasmid maintenance system antidote protein VapI
MTPREYWAHYVEANGGPTKVAERLGIPFPTIAAVCNGQRGIGKGLAQRMNQADPMLDASVLVWVAADRSQAA